MHCFILPRQVFIVEARHICPSPADMVFLGLKRLTVVEQWKKWLQKADLLESYITWTLSEKY